MLLYQAYDSHRALFAPLRLGASAVQPLADLARDLPGVGPAYAHVAAACALVSESWPRHKRPDFGIDSVTIDGRTIAVQERVVLERPFCRLLHFRKAENVPMPRVLIVAPMSGHFATLLRGTVARMIEDHDVYITDWVCARQVPLFHGVFDLDTYTDYMIEFMRHLGSDLHVLAVCQAAVPVLSAVSLMAAEDDPAQPRSMVLMGGPIDTRANPTQVNEVAEGGGMEMIKRVVVTSVPPPHWGMFRRVYPGFIQLGSFMGMNLDRHIGAHFEMFQRFVQGDGSGAEATRKFYDEYLSIMDLSADFYLQTVERIFQRHELARGVMTSRGRPIDPSRIRRVALMTVEGELDDVCGVGQTYASHRLCKNLPDSMREHHEQKGVGHYGVFNGRRWREEIAPKITAFHQTHAAA